MLEKCKNHKKTIWETLFPQLENYPSKEELKKLMANNSQ